MITKEQLKQASSNIGSEDWVLLADAAADQKFRGVLNAQEKQILENINSNSDVNVLYGYQDQFANIVSKYMSWKTYNKSGIKALEETVQNLQKTVNESEEEFKILRSLVTDVSGAQILVKYAESFNTSSETHEKAAFWQQIYYFLSLLLFCSIIGLVFFVTTSDFKFIKSLTAEDINSLPLNTGLVAIKAFLLVFAYQITQFFRKNYGAEKHLQEVYRHRCDVLQSLHAVYNNISSPQEKDEILKAGALFAYERGETGYITTKEGAGSGDSIFESLLNRVLR